MTPDERDAVLAIFDAHVDPLWRVSKRNRLREQLANVMAGWVVAGPVYSVQRREPPLPDACTVCGATLIPYDPVSDTMCCPVGHERYG